MDRDDLIKPGNYLKYVGRHHYNIILRVVNSEGHAIVIQCDSDYGLDWNVGEFITDVNYASHIWELIPHTDTKLWKVLNG